MRLSGRTNRFLYLAAALLIPLPASATLIDAIAALDPGDQYRVIFTTSTERNALSNDIADYDNFVQAAADSGGVTAALNLSWQAVASTYFVDAHDHVGAPQTSTAPVVIS